MLKESFTFAPVLTLLDGTKVFMVYCDSSRVRLGCVLMQHGEVIAYDSRKLKDDELNYPTHHLEFAVVVFALKTWRYSIYGVNVDVYRNY